MTRSTPRFICLDPRKAKRKAIEQVVLPLSGGGGRGRWLRLVPLRLRGYPETRQRAREAFAAATKIPKGKIAATAKRLLLGAQYNGARALFEKDRDTIAIAWNGLNGTRRVFMDAARDAGVRKLYFELCPFPGRITTDPCGVNFRNGLPRAAEPYLRWADGRDTDTWRDLRKTFRARRPSRSAPPEHSGQHLAGPFILVPLQVPGDSQLRLFGGNFPTVEATIKAIAEAATALPDGWHVRIKEHPSARERFSDLIAGIGHPKLVLDNATDTFALVEAARAVVTVNSSVGLEAMFYEKPVIAMGQCFWAIPGITRHCPDVASLRAALSPPEAIGFDPAVRAAFLTFLTEEYYPRLDHLDEDGNLHLDEVRKVMRRLSGPDPSGFWICPDDIRQARE